MDDHITGVLTEHQAGKLPGHARRRDQDARPALDPWAVFSGGQSRHGLGRDGYPGSADDHRTDRSEVRMAGPAAADGLHHRGARRLFRARRRADAPTGADAAGDRAAVARIGENCEPALCTVLFMAGAGGSLRAGATENPVLLTRSVQAGGRG